MSTLEELGRRMKLAREKIGLSQRDLATKAGCSHGSVAQTEKGASEMGWKTLLEISRVLGVSLLWLASEGPADQPQATVGSEISLADKGVLDWWATLPADAKEHLAGLGNMLASAEPRDEIADRLRRPLSSRWR